MSGSQTDDATGAGIRFPPPFIYAVFCAVGLILDRIWPIPVISQDIGRILGWSFAALSVVLMGICVVHLRRARTTIRPDKPTIAIVSDGPFAISRNPIYLGWTILFLGVAAGWGGLWTLLLVIPCAVVVHRYVVLREERYLSAKFGEAYAD